MTPLAVIQIYTSIIDTYWGFCNFFTPVYGSVVLAIQKLVKTYFVSSGDSIEYFHLDLSKVHGHDGSVFDVYTVGCMNTEIYHFIVLVLNAAG